jgi:hypothetical protein
MGISPTKKKEVIELDKKRKNLDKKKGSDLDKSFLLIISHFGHMSV